MKIQVLSLGPEDPLEKGMAIHSSIPAWRIPWTGEPGGQQSMGLQRDRHDWVTHTLVDNNSPLSGPPFSPVREENKLFFFSTPLDSKDGLRELDP